MVFEYQVCLSHNFSSHLRSSRPLSFETTPRPRCAPLVDSGCVVPEDRFKRLGAARFLCPDDRPATVQIPSLAHYLTSSFLHLSVCGGTIELAGSFALGVIPLFSMSESSMGIHMGNDIQVGTDEMVVPASAKFFHESERLFRKIFEQAAVGIAIIDTNTGRFIRINQKYTELIGYSNDEMTRLTFMDITFAEDLDEDLHNMKRLHLGEVSDFSMEKRLIRKDGTLTWVNLTVSPTWSAGETPEFHIAVVQDISARKKIEHDLRESEQRLRTLVEFAPEAIVMLDADTGKFVGANTNAERMFGMTQDQLKQVGPFELSPPLQADGRRSKLAGEEVIQRALAGDSPAFEWTHQDASGRLIPCEITLVKLPSASRNIVRGSIFDITERKKQQLLREGLNGVLELLATEASLNDVLSELSLIIERSNPGMLCSVLLLDEKTNCLRHCAAPNLPEFYNQAIDNLPIGPGVGSCGEAAHTAQRVIVEDVTTHPNWEMARELAKKVGFRACWSEPITSSDNKVLGTFAMYYPQPRGPNEHELECINTAADIAGIAIERIRADEELKALNESLEQRVAERTSELARLNEELQRNNQELRQFAYVASHDLQEPIRMVTTFCDLIRKNYGDQMDERSSEWFSFVVEGGKRMHDLVQDLLEYSRIESQARPFREISLDNVVNNVLANLRSSIEDTGAVLEVGELPTVMGDPPQLAQLLQNLISNAIKFQEDGNPRVRVSAGESSAEWIISVRDEGIGIEPEMHKGIFDIFRRLHSRERFPGTGIGLSICRRVAERHGGKIWVDSQLGKGSTFSFSLPKRRSGQ